jgi:double-strand break repair protein MRE11
MLSSVAHSDTGYLPEEFLPDFLDMVVWGHEHECLIDPKFNPGKNFYVIQPGSSIATSLMPGEAVPKHVAIMSVTGKNFKVEPIRLKTVRPFAMREIVLADEKEAAKLAKKANNRVELTAFLKRIVDEMIDQANQEWEDAQGDEERDGNEGPPLPLIRLRVEYTAPEGGNFDCENPQRFSNRFQGKVANYNDVVQFHRKKAGGIKRKQNGVDMPEESTLASMALDSVKVEKLVREFLAAQSLTILPQNSFGDAVSQFIDKDDKHAMESFVTENLVKSVESLMQMDHVEDEDTMREAMEERKSHLEQLFASDRIANKSKANRNTKPDNWDSDMDGAYPRVPVDRSDPEDGEDSDDATPQPASKPTANGRSKAAPKKAAAPARKSAPATKNARGKKKVIESDEDEEKEEEEDVVMLDSDDEEKQLFVKPAAPTRGAKKTTPAKAPAQKRAPARGAASQAGKQSQLNFSQPATQSRGNAMKKAQEISDDEISDDDDAFEPAPSARSTRSRR